MQRNSKTNTTMTKEEMKKLIDLSYSIDSQLKNAVREALLKIGHPVEFDWDNGNAPSISSGNFDDDITDAYVSKIWLDGDLIKVNLHAYYLGDDREDIDLGDECDVPYADILDYLLDEYDE